MRNAGLKSLYVPRTTLTCRTLESEIAERGEILSLSVFFVGTADGIVQNCGHTHVGNESSLSKPLMISIYPRRVLGQWDKMRILILIPMQSSTKS